MLFRSSSSSPPPPAYAPLAKEDPQAQPVVPSSWIQLEPDAWSHAHKRKRVIGLGFALVSGLAVLTLAAAGVYFFLALSFGRLQQLPSYTPAQLRDAGWLRKPTVLDQPFRSAPDQQPEARLTMHDFVEPLSATQTSSLHLLILTPLCNSENELDMLFRNLDQLTHPKANTSVGFLISDTTDGTGRRLRDFADERVAAYREITLLQKDFQLEMPSGEARHRLWAQGQRRAVMAKARTTLLMSTLRPDVDWVLWLDSDVAEMSPSLFEDLLVYGHTGVASEAPLVQTAGPRSHWADVVTPNVFVRKGPKQKLQAYDQNNWAETPASRRKADKLPANKLLVEGNAFLDTGRRHLVQMRTEPNATLSRWAPSIFPSLRPDGWEETNLYDRSSPAYVGQREELDAVGGVATLVRAETHRLGAIFPSWLENHELETEGFGVLAKKAGARIVGLPNYLVIHATR